MILFTTAADGSIDFLSFDNKITYFKDADDCLMHNVYLINPTHENNHI